MEHLCASLCFICTTAPRVWSIITPQSRDVEEAEGCRGLPRVTHHVRAELGQASSDVLGQAPLAAGRHGNCKMSLHAAAVGQALTLSTAPHPGSHVHGAISNPLTAWSSLIWRGAGF